MTKALARTASEIADEIRKFADPNCEFLNTITITRQKHGLGWVANYGGSTIPPEILKQAQEIERCLREKYDLKDE